MLADRRVEATWIAEAATGLSRAELARTAAAFDDETVERALSMARRRAAGEPLQYVTGVAGFRYLDLHVGPEVFIPRPETELVVERALEVLPPDGTVIDVGAGAGAIALSIAHERPDVRVIATESSSPALAWAEKNRARHALTVELVLCDLLAGVDPVLRGTVDVVVSNPPYVAAPESLPDEVVDHEPHEALFAGPSGLEVIGRLVREARLWLRPGGWLVIEIGEAQGAAVIELLRASDYRHARVDSDLTKRDRIASACTRG